MGQKHKTNEESYQRAQIKRLRGRAEFSYRHSKGYQVWNKGEQVRADIQWGMGIRVAVLGINFKILLNFDASLKQLASLQSFLRTKSTDISKPPPPPPTLFTPGTERRRWGEASSLPVWWVLRSSSGRRNNLDSFPGIINNRWADGRQTPPGIPSTSVWDLKGLAQGF